MKSKSRFTKIAVASGLIVASGAAVLGITGFASAELAPNRASTQVVAQADGTDAPVTDADGGTVGALAVDGQAPDHMGGPRFVTDALAKLLGLSTTDLSTQLQTKSLADIAKAQDVDLEKVKAQLIADFTEKEQAEVAEGKHTQAEVDQKIKDFTANVDTMVNNVRPAMGPGMGGKGGHGGPGFMKNAGADVAKILGLTEEDLRTQLQTKSLADIAKAQDVDIQKVKDAIIADLKTHLDAEVKAGEHTQAEADQKLKDMTARLDDIVNNVRPAMGPGKGGPGMGGHGHGDHDGDGPMGMGGPGGPLGQGDDVPAQGTSA